MNPFDFSTQRALLGSTLAVAVPLWVELIAADASADQLRERATRCSAILATNGDALMFRTKGTTADVFNALAEGVACMAFCPGGVKCFGSHWTYTAATGLVTASVPDEPGAPLPLPDPELFGPTMSDTWEGCSP